MSSRNGKRIYPDIFWREGNEKRLKWITMWRGRIFIFNEIFAFDFFSQFSHLYLSLCPSYVVLKYSFSEIESRF